MLLFCCAAAAATAPLMLGSLWNHHGNYQLRYALQRLLRTSFCKLPERSEVSDLLSFSNNTRIVCGCGCERNNSQFCVESGGAGQSRSYNQSDSSWNCI